MLDATPPRPVVCMTHGSVSGRMQCITVLNARKNVVYPRRQNAVRVDRVCRVSVCSHLGMRSYVTLGYSFALIACGEGAVGMPLSFEDRNLICFP